jgi:hypothetical protein
MAIFKTPNPTDYAVQLIKLHIILSNCAGALLFQNIQMDQQKENTLIIQLPLLWLMESPLNYSIMDFHYGRLDSRKKACYRRKPKEKKTMVTSEHVREPGFSGFL